MWRTHPVSGLSHLMLVGMPSVMFMASPTQTVRAIRRDRTRITIEASITQMRIVTQSYHLSSYT